MGIYYNESVLNGLTPLEGSGEKTLEQRWLKYRVPDDQQGIYRLVGIFDRLIFNIVADVTEWTEFRSFEESYKNGMIVDRAYYHVPVSRLSQTNDGRIPPWYEELFPQAEPEMFLIVFDNDKVKPMQISGADLGAALLDLFEDEDDDDLS